MAVYIGSKKVTSKKDYSRLSRSEKQAFSKLPSSTVEKVMTNTGSTGSGPSAANKIHASPTTAAVLAKVDPEEASKLTVTSYVPGSDKPIQTTVTPEEYARYEYHAKRGTPEKWYKETRRPMPLPKAPNKAVQERQEAALEQEILAKRKPVVQAYQRQLKAEQEERTGIPFYDTPSVFTTGKGSPATKVNPYTDYTGSPFAKDNMRQREFVNVPIKGVDPLTGGLVPTIGRREKIIPLRNTQDDLMRIYGSPMEKGDYEFSKTIKKLNLFDFNPQYTEYAKKDKSYMASQRAIGAAAHYIEDKPLTSLTLYATGVGVGAGAGALAAKKWVGYKVGVKLAGGVGTGLYAGSVGAGLITTPKGKRAEYIGRAGIKGALFGSGAKVGARTGSTAVTQFKEWYYPTQYTGAGQQFYHKAASLEVPFKARVTKHTMETAFSGKQVVTGQVAKPTLSRLSFSGTKAGQDFRLNVVQPRPGPGQTQYISGRTGDYTITGTFKGGVLNTKTFYGNKVIGTQRQFIGNSGLIPRQRMSLPFYSQVSTRAGDKMLVQQSQQSFYSAQKGYESIQAYTGSQKITRFQSTPTHRMASSKYLRYGDKSFTNIKARGVRPTKIKLSDSFKSPADIDIIGNAQNFVIRGEPITKYSVLQQRGGHLRGDSEIGVYAYSKYQYNKPGGRAAITNILGGVKTRFKGIGRGGKKSLTGFAPAKPGFTVAQTAPVAGTGGPGLKLDTQAVTLVARGALMPGTVRPFTGTTQLGQSVKVTAQPNFNLFTGLSTRTGERSRTRSYTRTFIGPSSGVTYRPHTTTRTGFNTYTTGRANIVTRQAIDTTIIPTQTTTTTTTTTGTGQAVVTIPVTPIADSTIIPGPVPPPPPPPPTQSFLLPPLPYFPSGGLHKKPGKKTKPRAGKKKYLPSLSAMTFNIVGTKPGKLSGLEQRPILKGGKKSKKSRKKALRSSALLGLSPLSTKNLLS